MARRIMNITYRAKAKATTRQVRSRKSPSTVVAWPVAASQPAAHKDARMTAQLNKKQNPRSDISNHRFYALTGAAASWRRT